MKKPPLWRRIQRKNYTLLDPLLRFLEISPENEKRISRSSTPFSLNVPQRLAEKMKKNSIEDPLFRQFIPLREETTSLKGLLDPVQDEIFRKKGRLLQKYRGRALLLTTSACAMHCRYCFRQNFDYGEGNYPTEELESIRNDPSLREIILSGGDPLSLSDEFLSRLTDDLEKIPHVKIIRFHTRFIIGIPERINRSFLRILSGRRPAIYFVLHVNHPRETDADVFRAVRQLRLQGFTVLNQAVLLRNVNDDFLIQKELHEKLTEHGILPYYLHQLDPVRQAMHFEVPPSRGLEIVRQLRESLPGYAVPKYVQEIPQRPSKTPLS